MKEWQVTGALVKNEWMNQPASQPAGRPASQPANVGLIISGGERKCLSCWCSWNQCQSRHRMSLLVTRQRWVLSSHHHHLHHHHLHHYHLHHCRHYYRNKFISELVLVWRLSRNPTFGHISRLAEDTPAHQGHLACTSFATTVPKSFLLWTGITWE